jgi:hypothetical protein
MNGGGAPIIVVKLLRTDTTLDLSQKGQSGKEQGNAGSEVYIRFWEGRARTRFKPMTPVAVTTSGRSATKDATQSI